MKLPTRKLALVFSVALLAFELWRFSEISAFLAPLWQQIGRDFMALAALPWWIAVPSLTVTLLAFIIPMIGVVWALRLFHRKVFRKRTAALTAR